MTNSYRVTVHMLLAVPGDAEPESWIADSLLGRLTENTRRYQPDSDLIDWVFDGGRLNAAAVDIDADAYDSFEDRFPYPDEPAEDDATHEEPS